MQLMQHIKQQGNFNRRVCVERKILPQAEGGEEEIKMKRKSKKYAYVKSGIGSFSLSWIRRDLPRELCMNYWREAHGQLVSRNSGCFSYRQIIFEENPLMELPGWEVDTFCPNEWIPEGIAENLIESIVGGIKSLKCKAAKLTHQDEKNAFSRIALYTTAMGDCLYHIEDATKTKLNGIAYGERVVLLFKRKGNDTEVFRQFVQEEIVEIIRSYSGIKELHSYVFNPYNANSWPSTGVSHEHPADRQYHGSLVIAADTIEIIEAMLVSPKMVCFINTHKNIITTVNAYKVWNTYVMRYNNEPTLAALRGSYVCDILDEIGATNQISDSMIHLLCRGIR